MLKISEGEKANGAATLRLEGQMIGVWVDEARELCERFLAAGCRLKLELSEVSYADRDGVSLLRELAGRRVTLVNCSPLLREQLKGAADQTE